MTLLQRIDAQPGAWTVEDLATLLQVSTKLIYKHVRTGKLRAYRIGTLVRLEPAEIKEWLESRATKASDNR